MSTTTVQHFSSPARKPEEETFRLHKPSDYSTPLRETHCSPGHRLQEQQQSRKSSKDEKLASREKARAAVTTPGKSDNNLEVVKTANIQPELQRTSLSLAVAMKVATSPTGSGFPDEFWAPFVEQEEYDRKKLLKLQQDHQERQRARRQAKAVTTTPAIRQSSNKFGKVIMSLFRWFLQTCVQLGCILFLCSLLDAPYFRPVFEGLVYVGRLVLGLSLWFHVFIMEAVLPGLQNK